MLYIYILILVTIGHHIQGAAIQKTNNSKLVKFSTRLTLTVIKKCLKNANDTTNLEVLEEFNKLKDKCWGSILLRNSNASGKELSEYCHAHKSDVVECLNRFGETLEPCLDPEESYIKTFVVNAFKKYSNYFCDNIKVISSAELERTNTRKCTSKFVSNPDKDPHKVCYEKSKIFGDDSSIDVITKEELCRDLQNIDSCYAKLFDEHCPDAPELKELQLGMQKEALTTCSDVA